MQRFDESVLKKLYIPPPNSHKGQNGKLLVVGGSHLFHAASLWSLSIASKIVDMVFYSSVPENNKIVQHAKEHFSDGIVVPRMHIDDYAKEADCILIGPGMVRNEAFRMLRKKPAFATLKEINKVENEGEQTYYLTKYLLSKYPEKKYVIDAGALQMLEPRWLEKLSGQVLLTPHPREFSFTFSMEARADNMQAIAKFYKVFVLVKGQEDVLCSGSECIKIAGGNAGMTKGGTGDVLAGLIAALACNNDMYLAALCGSYINKKAGENLFQKVGYYFNASDLINEIPKVMKELIL